MDLSSWTQAWLMAVLDLRCAWFLYIIHVLFHQLGHMCCLCWQEAEMRQKYMVKMEGQVISAKTAWQSHRKIVIGLQEQVSFICFSESIDSIYIAPPLRGA